MDFYMHHGRTHPDGAPQTKDASGVYATTEDWGFNGPRLTGVTGFHCTYGVHWHLWFEDSRAADEAAKLTGWDKWDDNALTVEFSDNRDLVRIRPLGSASIEYFGDWGIK